jgi:DNA-binding response OmpR family regulator
MLEQKKILVVESDPAWRERVLGSLTSPQLSVGAVGSAKEALDALAREKVDLLITEIALPDTTGFGLCRILQEDRALARVGILVVTVYASEIDRVLAFEVGADDVLAKPFYARELASRAAAVLRRSATASRGAGGPLDDAGGLVAIHDASNTVVVADERVELTPRELAILTALMRQPGRVLTRRSLIQRIWGEGSEQTDRVVDAHVKSIRRKLGPARHCVETVRGVGYRFSERAG